MASPRFSLRRWFTKKACKTLVYSSFPEKKCGIGTYAAEQISALKRTPRRLFTCTFDNESTANFRVDLMSLKSILRLMAIVFFQGFDEIYVHYTADFFFPPQDHLPRKRRHILRIAQSIWLICLGVLSGKTGSIIFHEAYPGQTQSRLLLLMRGFAFGRFGRLEFHTAEEKQRILAAFPRLISARRCHVVAHERFMTPKYRGNQADARRDLDIPLNQKVFLCIGFVQDHKGFHAAAEAMQKTGLKPEEARLYIVGSVRIPLPEYVAYRNWLAEQVAAMPNVTFVEQFVSDIDFDRWIIAADVVILPYREISSSGVGARAVLLEKHLFMNQDTNLKSQFEFYPYVSGFSDTEGLRSLIQEFRRAPQNSVERNPEMPQSLQDWRDMPILFVMPWFGPKVRGGAEGFIYELCLELQKKGRRIEIWSTDSSMIDPRDHAFRDDPADQGSGLRIRRFPANTWSLRIFRAAHARVSQDRNASALWGWLWKRTALSGRGMAKALKAEQHRFGSVHLCHYFAGSSHQLAGICPEKTILHPFIHDEPALYHTAMRDLFAGARGVICNTPAEKDLASQSQGGLLPQFFKPIGNGIQLLEAAQDSLPNVRPRKKEILYIGRMIHEKNLVELKSWVDAYNSQTTEKLHVILIGDGPLRDDPTFNQNPYLHFTGRVSEEIKAAYIKDLLAVIQPSRLESFSLVTIEAWSLKTPVLVHSECPATLMQIQMSGGGVAVKDSQEFIRAIDFLWDDTYLTGMLGQAGFDFATRHYTWAKVTQNFEEARAALMGHANSYQQIHPAPHRPRFLMNDGPAPGSAQHVQELAGVIVKRPPSPSERKFWRLMGADFYARFEAHFRDDKSDPKIAPSWPDYAALARKMKPHEVWIDLGAGRGHFLDFLKANTQLTEAQLFGVEPDSGSYAELRKKPYASCSMYGDSFLESLKDGSLDAISMLHVAEHIPWQELCSMLAILYRKLRPGGFVIIEVPNANTLKTSATNFWQDPTHIRPLVRETLMFLLTHCGFLTVESSVYAPHYDPEKMQRFKEQCGLPQLIDEIYGPQDLSILGVK